VRARAGRRAAAAARQPDSLEAAYAEAVKRLARQPQSRAALDRRLRELGYTEAAVAGALDRARADGYIDDREFAESLVRRRAAGRGHALIAQELRAKGVEELDAEAALGQVEPESEADRALAFGRRLLARKALADPEALLAYLGPRLSRRGFSSGLVYRVCRLLADEWQAAGKFDSI
jgi:regulatory protein